MHSFNLIFFNKLDINFKVIYIFLIYFSIEISKDHKYEKHFSLFLYHISKLLLYLYSILFKNMRIHV